MVRRHINNIREDETTVSFDLVVRDDRDRFTFGGGRVTLLKAEIATRELLDAALDAAVDKIVSEGNSAYPRTKAPRGPEPETFARQFRAHASRRNACRGR